MMYAVVRECCRSRHCIRCWPFPREGTRPPERGVLVCQGCEWTAEKAAEVAQNWRSYKASVIPNPDGLDCAGIERLAADLRDANVTWGGARR